ncbi:MAG: lipoprotein-releasing ABC transporter ATP-binding protein LolD [Gammaproteobacteria bacterium]|nr:MAG: lipoprotein-releasing ABC transporter ATP-binding protein LolD [Gammaproteobacteria bacterium]
MNDAVMHDTEANNILSCKDLAMTYSEGKLEVNVLKSISMEVKAGERIAIVGRSGAGKSTLLHLLGGLDTPDHGQVFVDGQDMLKLGEAARGKLRNKSLGFIYQFHHLLPEFSALENVAMPLLIRGEVPLRAEAEAMKILGQVGLESRAHHKPGEMSGGERQRAAVARALVTRPACVLADEPTGNLDHQTADQVYEQMLALNEKMGTSFIVVTHDRELAARMDRVLTLDEGVLS